MYKDYNLIANIDSTPLLSLNKIIDPECKFLFSDRRTYSFVAPSDFSFLSEDKTKLDVFGQIFDICTYIVNEDRYIGYINITSDTGEVYASAAASVFLNNHSKHAEMATRDKSFYSFTITYLSSSLKLLVEMIDKIEERYEIVKQKDLSYYIYTVFDPLFNSCAIKESVSWESYKNNYTKEIVLKIETLFSNIENKKLNGHMILFTGEPGTGKTYAADVLISKLYSSGYNILMSPSYDTIISSSDFDTKSTKNLFVFDDITWVRDRAMDSNSRTRLLNLFSDKNRSDDLFLLITNETKDKIDKAFLRAGRCAALVEFNRLSKEEALEIANNIIPIQDEIKNKISEKQSLSLAELYSIINDSEYIDIDSIVITQRVFKQIIA